MQDQGIPPGLCQCGCGRETNIAPKSDKYKSWVKGQPVRYVSGHQGSGPVVFPGQRYGRLVVLKLAGLEPSRRQRLYECACDCGNRTTVRASGLRGGTQSCGCLTKERVSAARKRATTHGLAGTPTYRTWASMIGRCYDQRNASWKNYGARGVTVCDRWRAGILDFVADMGLRPEGLTLDRIDPCGNYEPGNCRWATWSEQNRNKRPKT